MQLFDATLFALGCHGMDAKQLDELLSGQKAIGLEKGLGLRQRVAHRVTEAVTGADQAGNGRVPLEFVSERSVGASRRAAP